MPTFKIPNQPPTITKTVRFPADVIAEIQGHLRGTNGTFSAFVIAAVRYVLEDLKENSTPRNDFK